MKRRSVTAALVLALLAGAFWATTSVVAGDDTGGADAGQVDDPRTAGEVIDRRVTQTGDEVIDRAQGDGRIIRETRQANGRRDFEANEMAGPDGETVRCADGSTLKVPFESPYQGEDLTPKDVRRLQEKHGLDAGFIFTPGGKVLVDDPNDPYVYQCGPNNEPIFVPMSEAYPDEYKRQYQQRGAGR